VVRAGVRRRRGLDPGPGLPRRILSGGEAGPLAPPLLLPAAPLRLRPRRRHRVLQSLRLRLDELDGGVPRPDHCRAGDRRGPRVRTPRPQGRGGAMTLLWVFAVLVVGWVAVRGLWDDGASEDREETGVCLLLSPVAKVFP